MAYLWNPAKLVHWGQDIRHSWEARETGVLVPGLALDRVTSAVSAECQTRLVGGGADRETDH